MDRARLTVECRGRASRKSFSNSTLATRNGRAQSSPFQFGPKLATQQVRFLEPSLPRPARYALCDGLIAVGRHLLLSSHAPICPCRRARRCPQSSRSFVSNENNLHKSPLERVPTAEHAPARSTPFPCCIRLHSWLHSWIPSKAVAGLTGVAGCEFCFHLNGCLSLPWGCCAESPPPTRLPAPARSITLLLAYQ